MKLKNQIINTHVSDTMSNGRILEIRYNIIKGEYNGVSINIETFYPQSKREIELHYSEGQLTYDTKQIMPNDWNELKAHCDDIANNIIIDPEGFYEQLINQ